MRGLQQGPFRAYKQDGEWCVGTKDLTILEIHPDVRQAASDQSLNKEETARYYAEMVAGALNKVEGR